ncbi:SDR family oxidoreductase [Leekyejoonella antrihumi]|uniref:SDR family oxidoreductase n=1 Tax=Leekyejoonella antrihumi TaxID=1660198 RepID=A0A563DV76_9MICO|nr:SDR family oxidoreductase [Leekyejoonella antrihumi]TWP33822.1 SDR family oxidoreductase [Leekyejoonella antrihumi]
MTQPRSRPIVVVTGGTAGVGRATVREFAGAGYDVAILARGAAGLAGAAGEVEATGARALAIECDVADHEAVDAATDRVESELGPIDVWVNVAFVGSLSFFWDTDPQAYQRMTQVTYFGQVNGVRSALRVMRPRDRGAIVNVSSAMAYRSIPLQSAYCGAKHAIKGMTESVITELRATGSRVTIGLVTLPGVNTTQFNWNLNKMPDHPMPVPPIVQPEVCASAIRFSAEHPRRNMWVGISTAYTVMGNRVAPAFADWYLGKTGVKSQQVKKDYPRWGSNVFEPQDAEHDRGARGEFNKKAATRDPVSFVAKNRLATLAGGVAAVGVGIAAVVRVGGRS